MTSPGPGWYINPEDGKNLRWWTGEQWTEHMSPIPVQPQVPVAVVVDVQDPPYVPMASYYSEANRPEEEKLTRSEKDRQTRRNNSLAYTGCVRSLVGFLFNPFAILNILGIVFSAIGLAKSHELDGRKRVTGRGTAIAGMIVDFSA